MLKQKINMNFAHKIEHDPSRNDVWEIGIFSHCVPQNKGLFNNTYRIE